MVRQVVYRVASVILALATLALAAVIIVPSVSDVRLLAIETGSMEPMIAVDDVVVTVPVADAEDLSEGDVVAYLRNGSTVVHRIVTNRPSLGEVVTKGDANEAEDLDPVPYDAISGRSVFVAPHAKEALDALSSVMGKVYVAIAAACAVLLWVRADQIGRRRRRERSGGEEGHRVGFLGIVVKLALAGVLVASVVLVMRYRAEQGESISSMRDTVSDYVSEDEQSVPPFSVDFDAMRAENPDVVGWLRCEGTPIDFPVVKGPDNDWYLRRNWKGEHDMCGSVFVDAAASDGFADARTVVYGHHMNDNLMFACLEDWGDQRFYEEHPDMWLLTPGHAYRLELVAGEHIPATSDAYLPATEHDEAFAAWLADYVGHSDFKTGVSALPEDRYVMLSTCAYVYEDARYTLLGKLVEVA